MIRARVVREDKDGSMTVLVEKRVFDKVKNDWAVLQKFPLSITKGTRGVRDATYDTYRFGKRLEPQVAWKVIEAIERHSRGEDAGFKSGGEM